MSKKVDQAEWENRIKKAIKANGPFSHNIISLALNAIASENGKEAANKVIDKLKLQKLGWAKEE